MAVNLGAFDAEQTLMALIPDAADGVVTYRLLSNAEAHRVTRDLPA